jgi:DNA-binding NarL/FixJ family response regulator
MTADVQPRTVLGADAATVGLPAHPGALNGPREAGQDAIATRVLICGDILVVRNALAMLLDSAADIDVIDTTGNGVEAIILARMLRPDVVVTDLKVEGIPGLEMIRRVRSGDLEPCPQVVVFAVTDADEIVSDVLHAGASGVLDEGASQEDLMLAVRLAARGQVMLSPVIAKKLVSWFRRRGEAAVVAPEPAMQSLTPREREVMLLIGRGLSADEIAGQLTIGVATARTHIYRVRRKLGARDRAQIVSFAYRSGLMASAQRPRIASPSCHSTAAEAPQPVR